MVHDGQRATTPTVQQLGERKVLPRVLAQLSPAQAAKVGPGDDAAVLTVEGELVITSDTMIEGPDFRLDWHNGFDLGWKLAATNLSDVAAMGARPIALTVSLACPRETGVELLEDIARGLDAACQHLAPGCGVVGGDLGTAPVLTAAVTALGDLQGRAAVLRSGARAGEVLAYCGQLGLAGLGLSQLFQNAPEKFEVAVRAQLRPEAPISSGMQAAGAGATAMMDVSDGLVLDSARLAEASGVTLALESECLLRVFGSQNGQQVPLEAMLFGGEDHRLLATFAAEVRLPPGFHRIGEVRASASATRTSGHETPALYVLLDELACEPRGWDPYRPQ
jgi:thiamine-monophosphate kinase